MPEAFVPEQILAALVEHGVAFVLIGGMAAVAHGSPLPTRDVDVTPDTSAANLDRLARALQVLDARVRDTPEGRPLPGDAASLAAAGSWNLTTPYGDLDVFLTPAGTSGYAGLRAEATTFTFRGVTLQLASLADVVRSKAAADRPKDHRALPVLRELLAQQRELRTP